MYNLMQYTEPTAQIKQGLWKLDADLYTLPAGLVWQNSTASRGR